MRFKVISSVSSLSSQITVGLITLLIIGELMDLPPRGVSCLRRPRPDRHHHHHNHHHQRRYRQRYRSRRRNDTEAAIIPATEVITLDELSGASSSGSSSSVSSDYGVGNSSSTSANSTMEVGTAETIGIIRGFLPGLNLGGGRNKGKGGGGIFGGFGGGLFGGGKGKGLFGEGGHGGGNSGGKVVFPESPAPQNGGGSVGGNENSGGYGIGGANSDSGGYTSGSANTNLGGYASGAASTDPGGYTSGSANTNLGGYPSGGASTNPGGYTSGSANTNLGGYPSGGASTNPGGYSSADANTNPGGYTTTGGSSTGQNNGWGGWSSGEDGKGKDTGSSTSGGGLFGGGSGAGLFRNPFRGGSGRGKGRGPFRLLSKLNSDQPCAAGLGSLPILSRIPFLPKTRFPSFIPSGVNTCDATCGGRGGGEWRRVPPTQKEKEELEKDGNSCTYNWRDSLTGFPFLLFRCHCKYQKCPDKKIRLSGGLLNARCENVSEKKSRCKCPYGQQSYKCTLSFLPVAIPLVQRTKPYYCTCCNDESSMIGEPLGGYGYGPSQQPTTTPEPTMESQQVVGGYESGYSGGGETSASENSETTRESTQGRPVGIETIYEHLRRF